MITLDFSSKNDFDKFLLYKSGSGAYTSDSTNKKWTLLTTDAISRCYLRLQLSNLSVGDRVKVYFEIEGVGQFGITLDGKTDVWGNRSNEWREEYSVETSKKGSITMVAKSNGNFEVVIGALYGMFLNATIKTLSISITSNTAFYKNAYVDRLVGVIQKSSAGVFAVRDDLSKNACTMVETDANTITITFTESLKSKAVSFPNFNFFQSSYQYIPRLSNETVNSTQLKFYNSIDNTVVPLASVANYTTVGIMLV